MVWNILLVRPYADDLVMFADTAYGLQAQLDELNRFGKTLTFTYKSKLLNDQTLEKFGYESSYRLNSTFVIVQISILCISVNGIPS